MVKHAFGGLGARISPPSHNKQRESSRRRKGLWTRTGKHRNKDLPIKKNRSQLIRSRNGKKVSENKVFIKVKLMHFRDYKSQYELNRI